MAEGIHLVKAKLRLMSSAMTATVANPLLSLVEDVVAVVATILSVLLPVLVLVAAVILSVVVFRRFREPTS